MTKARFDAAPLVLVIALVALVLVGCGSESNESDSTGSRTFTAGRHNEEGLQQDIPWRFRAEPDGDHICLSLEIDLKDPSPAARELTSTRVCHPSVREANELTVVDQAEIPRTSLGYLYGFAATTSGKVRAVFASGPDRDANVVNGTFVVVYDSSGDLRGLQLRRGKRTIAECHTSEQAERPC